MTPEERTHGKCGQRLPPAHHSILSGGQQEKARAPGNPQPSTRNFSKPTKHMTPEEQRIAIAEACGYAHMPNAAGLMWNTKENRAVITPGSKVEEARLRMKLSYKPGKEALPDYLNDLNAMHETILAVIDPHFIEQFHEALYDILERDWTPARWHMFSKPCQFYAFAMATAAQRAEAFLRTIGKWKDMP